MTTEELAKLRELAQQCCDVWSDILGLHQWSIVVEVVDDDLKELPETEYNPHIAAAKIIVPTGDRWKELYKDFWAPYSMEVHIIAQLLDLMGVFPSVSTYHLARVLSNLKSRGDILQNMVNEAEQNATKQEAPVEVVEPEVEEPVNAEEPELES